MKHLTFDSSRWPLHSSPAYLATMCTLKYGYEFFVINRGAYDLKHFQQAYQISQLVILFERTLPERVDQGIVAGTDYKL